MTVNNKYGFAFNYRKKTGCWVHANKQAGDTPLAPHSGRGRRPIEIINNYKRLESGGCLESALIASTVGVSIDNSSSGGLSKAVLEKLLKTQTYISTQSIVDQFGYPERTAQHYLKAFKTLIAFLDLFDDKGKLIYLVDNGFGLVDYGI